MISTAFTESMAEALVIGASVIGIVFGLLNAFLILRIKIINREESVMALKDDKIIRKYQSMQ